MLREASLDDVPRLPAGHHRGKCHRPDCRAALQNNAVGRSVVIVGTDDGQAVFAVDRLGEQRVVAAITQRVGARMDCDPSLHLGSSSHLLRTETGIPKLVIRLSALHPILASVR